MQYLGAMQSLLPYLVLFALAIGVGFALVGACASSRRFGSTAGDWR